MATHGKSRTGWRRVRERTIAAAVLLLAPCLSASVALGQTKGASAPQTIQLATLPASANAGSPLTLSLSDALERAQKNSPQFQAAVTVAKMARQNQVQARASMLPSLSDLSQYLNTQGNGISPVGRFVTNDGVHVYRQWAVVHQDMPGSFFIGAAPRLAAYQTAVAKADQQIALRGLNVTVTQDYYTLVVAQRNYAIAEQTLASARRFLKISQALEQGGEVARADVIRFQLEVNTDQRALEDANLTMEQARMNLSVLLFPKFNQNFTVVDDLDTPPVLPSFRRAEAMAGTENPDLAAALNFYHAAGVQVAMAKAAFFPSFSIDFDYGIEANRFALQSENQTKPGIRMPNLGYFVTYSMSFPVWDWGTNLSRLRQAKDQKALAQLNLTYAQRQLMNNLYSYYNEAATAWNQLGNLRDSVDLAEHNLQLVTMQYQSGETTVVSVLDAETSLATARTGYAVGEERYRNALAALQTITGSF
ncbi:MAG TPA: TolC family protein [Candidatus Dormibacteraeota bacterium]|nr:TolC family protein [Candidatus Dormibacteraeota bacterium]